MQTLEALRKKIGTAEDLFAIVRTMKTLAAVNIRHYEKAVESTSDYYRTVELGLRAVLRKEEVDVIVKSGKREGGLGAVIFGSDQGLCGGFNDQIISHAAEVMSTMESARIKKAVVCVGSRAFMLLEETGPVPEELFSVPGSLGGITPLVQSLLMKLDSWQAAENISHIVLFHNTLLSSAAYQPGTVKLLPLDRLWVQHIAAKKWPTRILPMYTLERKDLFSSLLREYIFVSLFRAAAESMASENAARLASMQAAERNIEDRLEDLQKSYRDQRQTSITDELLDIVSGFEALRPS